MEISSRLGHGLITLILVTPSAKGAPQGNTPLVRKDGWVQLNVGFGFIFITSVDDIDPPLRRRPRRGTQ